MGVRCEACDHPSPHVMWDPASGYWLCVDAQACQYRSIDARAVWDEPADA